LIGKLGYGARWATRRMVVRIRWPEGTVFTQVVLDVEQDSCERCGSSLHVCDHRIRRIYTLEGPVRLCCRLRHCADRACPLRSRTLSPSAELSIALPWWLVGGVFFCFRGQAPFAPPLAGPAAARRTVRPLRHRFDRCRHLQIPAPLSSHGGSPPARPSAAQRRLPKRRFAGAD